MIDRRQTLRHSVVPNFELCEDRALTTLIFVFNGDSFRAAKPSQLTANAATILHRAGNQVVQLSNSAINSATAFKALAARVTKLAHGQSVGLVGFSAGGALALRIAATPDLKVTAVLDYYGVPDVQSYLQRHSTDHIYRPISGLAPFRPTVVSLLSGPVVAQAHVVAAFGQFDPNVRADTSSTDLVRDNPTADVYTYAGGHGVAISASLSALDDFLAHV